MASASQQQALGAPPQLEPDRPLEDFGAAKRPAKAQRPKLGFLKLEGMQHILRLRSRLQLADNLFADLGADCSLNRRAVYPRMALEYRVHNKKDKHIATLRADKRALFLQKSFPINLLNKVSARLQATAATTYQGVPEFVVGMEQVKPSWLIPVGAVLLLAAGKSVSGSKTFAGSTVQLPVLHQDSTVKGEAKASVSRRGKGLMLTIQQLNGILRI